MVGTCRGVEDLPRPVAIGRICGVLRRTLFEQAATGESPLLLGSETLSPSLQEHRRTPARGRGAALSELPVERSYGTAKLHASDLRKGSVRSGNDPPSPGRSAPS